MSEQNDAISLATGDDAMGEAMQRAYAKIAGDWNTDTGRLNVMVVGGSGVGKSTVINALFDSDVAPVGTGGPQTMAMASYTVPGKPVTIYDTRGFEMSGEETIKLVDEQIKTLRACPKEADQLHVAWLCVQQNTQRFEPAHEDFVKRAVALSLPLVVVVTKSVNDAAALEQHIAQAVGDGVPVVNVMAQDMPTKAGVVSREGLDKLLEATLAVMPEGRRTAFIAAQTVSDALKDKEAQKAIGVAVTAAAATALIPAPGAQIIAMGAVQATLMARLDNLAGLPTSSATKYAKLAGIAAARGGATKLAQLATAQLLKFVPAIGTAGGMALGASVASAMTLTLGNAYWHAAKLAVRTGMTGNADEIGGLLKQFMAKPPAAAAA